MRFFPSTSDKLGTSPDNVGRKEARPGRFWSSTPAKCTGKGKEGQSALSDAYLLASGYHVVARARM